MITTIDLAGTLIAEQFPEDGGLPITDVEKQWHDNPKSFLASLNLLL